MPTVTTPLNLTKPTVGGDKDVWGQYWNDNADKLNAIHIDNGTGTSVGMHVGTGKVLKVDGGTSDVILPGQLDTQTLRLRDAIDATKVVDFKADLITTATTRTLKAPDRSGTIALEEFVTEHMPTGTVLHGYWGSTPPAGFVFADGRSIGDASSGATNRAHATDTRALFTRFWTFNDAVRFPLQNPDGSAATRGVSAAADFDAHKRIGLPNHSGRVAAGRDDLSGTAAGVWAGATTVGVVGGATAHTLSPSEMPLHDHGSGTLATADHAHNARGLGLVGNNLSNGTTRAVGTGDGTNAGYFQELQITVDASGTLAVNSGVTGGRGGNVAHNNIQPTIVVDVVIAL
jgi:microcystin-dependent protein